MKAPLRNFKVAIHESLCNVFTQWRKDQEWTFDDWVREETFGVGKGLCVSFGNAVQAMQQQPESLGEIMQHPMNHVLGVLHDAGIPSNAAYEKLADFFRSEVFSEIPSVKISALMFAAVARQAAHLGRKEPPDRGFATDVSAISAFLPYCDAMLIDNKCRAILKDNPVLDRLGFQTQLYSKANVNNFIVLLDEIAATTTAEHETALAEIYGSDFVNRFKQVFP